MEEDQISTEKPIKKIPIIREKTSNLPGWLTHKPVLACRYDEAALACEDAKFISIGKATYDADCASVKIWRRTDDDLKWSRQSEEIPIHRVGLCMQMLLSAIRLAQCAEGEYPAQTALMEEIQSEDCISFLKSAIEADGGAIKMSLLEIRKLMEEIDFEKI